jgi:hypothetical protein
MTRKSSQEQLALESGIASNYLDRLEREIPYFYLINNFHRYSSKKEIKVFLRRATILVNHQHQLPGMNLEGQ